MLVNKIVVVTTIFLPIIQNCYAKNISVAAQADSEQIFLSCMLSRDFHPGKRDAWRGVQDYSREEFIKVTGNTVLVSGSRTGNWTSVYSSHVGDNVIEIDFAPKHYASRESWAISRVDGSASGSARWDGIDGNISGACSKLNSDPLKSSRVF